MLPDMDGADREWKILSNTWHGLRDDSRCQVGGRGKGSTKKSDQAPATATDPPPGSRVSRPWRRGHRSKDAEIILSSFFSPLKFISSNNNKYFSHS